MTTLLVNIKCKLGQAYQVAAYIVDDVEACEIYSTSGAYDLFAIFHLPKDVDPGVFVTKRLHSVPGLEQTNTTIAFNAFTPSQRT